MEGSSLESLEAEPVDGGRQGTKGRQGSALAGWWEFRPLLSRTARAAAPGPGRAPG